MSVYEVKPDSNLTDGDYEDLNGLQAALAGYKQMGNGRASFNLYYRYTDANRFNANQPEDPDTQNDATNSVFGGTIDYRFASPVGKSAIGLRFGIDGSTASSKVQLYADSTKFGGTNVLTTDVQSPLSDIAGFALADYTAGRVTLSGGLRYDYVSVPFHNLHRSRRATPPPTTAGSIPRVGVDVNAGQGRLGLRLVRHVVPRAVTHRGGVRRSRGAVPAALRAGRRPADRAGHREHLRGRRPLPARGAVPDRHRVLQRREERHLPLPVARPRSRARRSRDTSATSRRPGASASRLRAATPSATRTRYTPTTPTPGPPSSPWPRSSRSWRTSASTTRSSRAT